MAQHVASSPALSLTQLERTSVSGHQTLRQIVPVWVSNPSGESYALMYCSECSLGGFDGRCRISVSKCRSGTSLSHKDSCKLYFLSLMFKSAYCTFITSSNGVFGVCAQTVCNMMDVHAQCSQLRMADFLTLMWPCSDTDAKIEIGGIILRWRNLLMLPLPATTSHQLLSLNKLVR